jgi:CYTH domain-containing protein
MKPDHLEIEYRFLVLGSDWKKVFPFITIEQRYISCHPDRSVRIRVMKDQAFITIKGSRVNNENIEFEWPIDVLEAQSMFSNPTLFTGYPIIKNRYAIPEKQFSWKGKYLTWHVDEFLGQNHPLQIAEIELENIGSDAEKIELSELILNSLPPWIGHQIDPDQNPDESRYNNVELAQNPFSVWPRDHKTDMLNHL